MSAKQNEAAPQPTPWSIEKDGLLYDALGKNVRISGFGTALNATGFFPNADANLAFMLRAVNGFYGRPAK